MVSGKDKNHKVLVVASGTAGHILPSIELIKELLQRGYSVDWVGYKASLETDFFHDQLKHIKVFTQSPRSTKRLLSLSFYRGIFHDLGVLANILFFKRYRFVLLTGGFVGFLPGLLALFSFHKIIIYEQNVVFGAANRFFSFFAKERFFGLMPFYDKDRIYFTGQPLRTDIRAINMEPQRAKNLLIIGGSLGASFFNQQLVDMLLMTGILSDWKITHCCGQQEDPLTLQERYEKSGINAEVVCYTNRIDLYYKKASHVIARAGAMTLAELDYLPIFAMIVPLPNSAGNHQVKNACMFKNNKKFTICAQETLHIEQLVNFLRQSCDNLGSASPHATATNPTIEIIDRCLML